jgi:hypothetical protein
MRTNRDFCIHEGIRVSGLSELQPCFSAATGQTATRRRPPPHVQALPCQAPDLAIGEKCPLLLGSVLDAVRENGRLAVGAEPILHRQALSMESDDRRRRGRRYLQRRRISRDGLEVGL